MNIQIRKSALAAAFSLFAFSFSMNAIADQPAKTLSVQVKTKYSQSDIVSILKKEGYWVDEAPSDPFMFKVDGKKFAVSLYDNGDVQLISMYGSDDSFSLRKVNELNSEVRTGKYYLTDKGGLVIEVTLRNDENGLSKAHIIQGVKDIVSLDKRALKTFADK